MNSINFLLAVFIHMHILQTKILAKPSDVTTLEFPTDYMPTTLSTATQFTSSPDLELSTQITLSMNTILTDISSDSLILSSVKSSTLKSKSKPKIKAKTRVQTQGKNIMLFKDNLPSKKSAEGSEDEEEEHDEILNDSIEILKPHAKRRKKIKRIKKVGRNKGDRRINRQREIKKQRMIKPKTLDFDQEKVKKNTRTFGLFGMNSLTNNPFKFINPFGRTLHIIKLYRKRFPFFVQPDYYYDTNYVYYDDSDYAGNYYYDDTNNNDRTIFITTTEAIGAEEEEEEEVEETTATEEETTVADT